LSWRVTVALVFILLFVAAQTACADQPFTSQGWNVPTIDEYSNTAPDPSLTRLPPIETLTVEPYLGIIPTHEHSARDWINYQPFMPADDPVFNQLVNPPETFEFHWLARSYYIYDLRIEFTGQEATFGVEGAVAGSFNHAYHDWQFNLHSELYLNQPYGKNLLADAPERISYHGNFDIEPLQISQLYMTARRGDLFMAVGRMVTPFGRTYFPLYRNARDDAPFIRTESILWRETGLLVQFDPGNFSIAAAVTNGSDARDNNSSKGLVARIGYDTEQFAIGASVKYQDGNGSENHKEYNNHVGADIMLKRGRIRLSGEAIYDQYGFRQPFDPLDITWRKSIYYRQQNQGMFDPITGFGFYANLDIELDRWTVMLNYGEFHPEKIGERLHDTTNRRGIVKTIWHLNQYADAYLMTLIENDAVASQNGRLRKGIAVLGGIQISR